MAGEPILEQDPREPKTAPAGRVGSGLDLEQRDATPESTAPSPSPQQAGGLEGILDDVLEPSAPAPAAKPLAAASPADQPPLPIAVNVVAPQPVAPRPSGSPKGGVEGLIDSTLGRSPAPKPLTAPDRPPSDPEGRQLEVADPDVWRTLPLNVQIHLGRGPGHAPRPLSPDQWRWALNQRDHPEIPAVAPPTPEEEPSAPRTVASPTATDVDKANIFRRVMDGDPTVARTDAQVARAWISAGLARGNPAVLGLFSKQELADAGYGDSPLDGVISNLLSRPSQSSAPTTLLPVPGTRVVPTQEPAPMRPAPVASGGAWVDTYLAEPPPARAPAVGTHRLPVPGTVHPGVAPAKPSKPLTGEQVHRVLYPPELSDLAENGGQIVSDLDPGAEAVALASDGTPVPMMAENPFEAWALAQAAQERRLSSPENQPCDPGGPCYRGPKTPAFLLRELRELCTGDPFTPVTAATSGSCLQRAVYGEPADAAPDRPRYFGLAVDQIAPEAKPERVEAGATLRSKATETARDWFGVAEPTQEQVTEAAEEIVAANPERFPGAGDIDISDALATDRALSIPASPAEWRNHRQAILDGQAIDTRHVLRQRDAFINEPMPVAPAEGDEPAYYRRGPDGTGYFRATGEEYEQAVAELGREVADALFIPGREVERRIPLSQADPDTRAAVERHYEELRTSEATNKDYVPSEGLASPKATDGTRVFVPSSAAQLDWYVRHHGLDAARDTFIADGWIPHDVEATATERALYDSRNFEKDFEENVVPMVWEVPRSIGVELWNRTVADPVERVDRISSGAGEAEDFVGAVPLVGGLLLGSPTEPREGQPWLEHYSERYPATGGTMQLGVDVFERYLQPAWGGLALGLGRLAGQDRWAEHGAGVLRDNRTFEDPITGETRVGDLKLIRDYRDRPASTLVADGSLVAMATGVKLVPVRSLVHRSVSALERSGRIGATTVRAGRSVARSKPVRRVVWGVTTLANVADPVIVTANVLLGGKKLAARTKARRVPPISQRASEAPSRPAPAARSRLGLRGPTHPSVSRGPRARQPLAVPGRVGRVPTSDATIPPTKRGTAGSRPTRAHGRPSPPQTRSIPQGAPAASIGKPAASRRFAASPRIRSTAAPPAGAPRPPASKSPKPRRRAARSGELVHAPKSAGASDRLRIRRPHPQGQHQRARASEETRTVGSHLERVLTLLGLGFLLHEGTAVLLAAGMEGRRLSVERPRSHRTASATNGYDGNHGIHGEKPNDHGRPPPAPEIDELLRSETDNGQSLHGEGTRTRGPPPTAVGTRSPARAPLIALRAAWRAAAVALATVAVTLFARAIHWDAGVELMPYLMPVVALPHLKTGITRPGRARPRGSQTRPGLLARTRARVNGLGAALAGWDPVAVGVSQREIRPLSSWQMRARGQALRARLELYGDIADVRAELLALVAEAHLRGGGDPLGPRDLRRALARFRLGQDVGDLRRRFTEVLGRELKLPRARVLTRLANHRHRALATLRISPWRAELALIFAEEQRLWRVWTLDTRYSDLRRELQGGKRINDLLPAVYALVSERLLRAEGIMLRLSQLIGAIEVHWGGRVLDMATGQGKTLVPLPAIALDALTGRGGFHVWTSDSAAARNGYGVARRHLEPLGITIGLVTRDAASAPGSPRFRRESRRSDSRRPGRRVLRARDEQPTGARDARRAAYATDATYGVWDAVGFDSMLRGDVDLGIKFRRVVLDEADRILIDNADTPLVISAPVDKPRVLVAPETYAFFASLVDYLDGPAHYVYDARGSFNLTPEGWAVVRQKIRNRSELLGDDWHLLGPDELPKHVSERTRLVVETLRQLVQKALEAKHMSGGYHVRDGDLKLHDGEHRTADGRRFQDGLDEALRAKHGLRIEPPTRMAERVTVEALVGRFDHVSGLTGSARAAARELRGVYGLDVVLIPRHGRNNRVDHPDRIFRTARAKLEAAVVDIVERHKNGQPVLVGMTSINRARLLKRRLRDEGIRARLLTARNESSERYVIAQAGRRGAVTISTITYRAQDIKLGGDPTVLRERLELRRPRSKGLKLAGALVALLARLAEEGQHVVEAGGLYVLGLERESSRNDLQLQGRSGRGEEPGESRFYTSLEDPLVMRNAPPWLLRRAAKLDEGQLGSHWVARRAVGVALRRANRRMERVRAQTRRFERPLDSQRRRKDRLLDATVDAGARAVTGRRWSGHLETVDGLRRAGARGWAYRRAVRRSFAEHMSLVAVDGELRGERPSYGIYVGRIEVLGDGSIRSERPLNPAGVDLSALNQIRSGRARFDESFTAHEVKLVEHAAGFWIEHPSTALDHRLADAFAELLPRRALDEWDVWEADRLRRRSVHSALHAPESMAPTVSTSLAPDYDLVASSSLARLDRRARAQRPPAISESRWYDATPVERVAVLTDHEIAAARQAAEEAERPRSPKAAAQAARARRWAEKVAQLELRYIALVQAGSASRAEAEEIGRVQRSLDLAHAWWHRTFLMAWRSSEPGTERGVAETRATLADLVVRQQQLKDLLQDAEKARGPFRASIALLPVAEELLWSRVPSDTLDVAVEELARARTEVAWARIQQAHDREAQASTTTPATDRVSIDERFAAAQGSLRDTRRQLGAAIAIRRERALADEVSLAADNESVRVLRAEVRRLSDEVRALREAGAARPDGGADAAAGRHERHLRSLPPDRIAHVHSLTSEDPAAYFKSTTNRPADWNPRDWGHDPEQAVRNEVAAWRLAVALGPEVSALVAAVVWRTIDGQVGALSLRVPGEVGAWQAATDEEKSWAAFYDALIGNQDRNPTNAAAGPLGLFDHEFAFATNDDRFNSHMTFVRWRWWAGREALLEREREMLRGLLDSRDLLGVEQLLPVANAEALRERARQMLAADTIVSPSGVKLDELHDPVEVYRSMHDVYVNRPSLRPIDWDFGEWHDGKDAYLVSWIPRTRAVVAVRAADPSSQPEVLGRVAHPEQLRALLAIQDAQSTLTWARQQVESLASQTGRVVLDFTNKSATVTTDGDESSYLYGPGVTRRNTADVIAADGWRFVPGSEWTLTSPPDGFWRAVEQAPRKSSSLTLAVGGVAMMSDLPDWVVSVAQGGLAAAGAVGVAWVGYKAGRWIIRGSRRAGAVRRTAVATVAAMVFATGGASAPDFQVDLTPAQTVAGPASRRTRGRGGTDRDRLGPVIIEALRAMEGGEDVPELGSDLPPGLLEYRWTQLRVLHAVVVEGMSRAGTARELNLPRKVVRDWVDAFLVRGRLGDLPETDEVWRRFDMSDLVDLERQARELTEGRDAQPRSEVVRVNALLMLAQGKRSERAVADELGVPRAHLQLQARAYLAARRGGPHLRGRAPARSVLTAEHVPELEVVLADLEAGREVEGLPFASDSERNWRVRQVREVLALAKDTPREKAAELVGDVRDEILEELAAMEAGTSTMWPESPYRPQQLRALKAVQVDGLTHAEAAAEVSDEHRPVTSHLVRYTVERFRKDGFAGLPKWHPPKTAPRAKRTSPVPERRNVQPQPHVYRAHPAVSRQMEAAVLKFVAKQVLVPLEDVHAHLRRLRLRPELVAAVVDGLLRSQTLRVVILGTKRYVTHGPRPAKPGGARAVAFLVGGASIAVEFWLASKGGTTGAPGTAAIGFAGLGWWYLQRLGAPLQGAGRISKRPLQARDNARELDARQAAVLAYTITGDHLGRVTGLRPAELAGVELLVYRGLHTARRTRGLLDLTSSVRGNQIHIDEEVLAALWQYISSAEQTRYWKHELHHVRHPSDDEETAVRLAPFDLRPLLRSDLFSEAARAAAVAPRSQLANARDVQEGEPTARGARVAREYYGIAAHRFRTYIPYLPDALKPLAVEGLREAEEQMALLDRQVFPGTEPSRRASDGTAFDALVRLLPRGERWLTLLQQVRHRPGGTLPDADLDEMLAAGGGRESSDRAIRAVGEAFRQLDEAAHPGVDAWARRLGRRLGERDALQAASIDRSDRPAASRLEDLDADIFAAADALLEAREKLESNDLLGRLRRVLGELLIVDDERRPETRRQIAELYQAPSEVLQLLAAHRVRVYLSDRRSAELATYGWDSRFARDRLPSLDGWERGSYLAQQGLLVVLADAAPGIALHELGHALGHLSRGDLSPWLAELHYERYPYLRSYLLSYARGDLSARRELYADARALSWLDRASAEQLYGVDFATAVEANFGPPTAPPQGARASGLTPRWALADGLFSPLGGGGLGAPPPGGSAAHTGVPAPAPRRAADSGPPVALPDHFMTFVRPRPWGPVSIRGPPRESQEEQQ